MAFNNFNDDFNDSNDFNDAEINVLDGNHFDNLNLDGLIDFVEDENVVIEEKNNGSLDGQSGTVDNIRQELAQGSGNIEHEELNEENYDQEFVQAPEPIGNSDFHDDHQQPPQSYYEEDVEPVGYGYSNQDYLDENQQGIVNYVEDQNKIPGGNLAGNNQSVNFYHHQYSHYGTGFIGNDQILGNTVQNHQQFGWNAYVAVSQHNQAYNAPAALQLHGVDNQENVNPAHRQFVMPQHQIGLNYEQRSPQKRVDEIATANERLNRNVAYIDTKDLAERMRTWLNSYNVYQKDFSKPIIGKDQAYFSDLIGKQPKRFEDMGKKKKENYIRMYNFLECSEQDQLAFLKLQLVSLKEKKMPAEKRIRTTIVEDQRKVLREYLKPYSKVSDVEVHKEEIARRVGLNANSVIHFFKNDKKTK